MRNRAVRAAFGLVTILVTACSADDPSAVGSGAPSEESVAVAAHNDVDVTFARSMISHQEKVVEMAHLASDHAEDERVRDLAERIEAAGAPEIEQLEEWLGSWGARSDGDAGGMEHAAPGPGSGMTSDGDMAALASIFGAEFDRMFVEMMIAHHQGAVDMADRELADGESAGARALAEELRSAQEREIAEMESLLVAL